MLEREGSARAEKSELGAAVRRSGILVQKCTPEEVHEEEGGDDVDLGLVLADC